MSRRTHHRGNLTDRNVFESKRRLNPCCRILRFEPLEDRRLLAVFSVTNLDDLPVVAPNDAPGTLRQAIFDANASPGGDMIEFDPSLTNGGPAMVSLYYGQLNISDSLTISGPGAGLLTIDAEGLSRIFNIDDSDGGNLLDVTISGLTLTGGDTLGGGGGIWNAETLTIADSVVTGNSADSGGGIYSALGSLELIRSTVSGNMANSRGGGLFNGISEMSIVDSTLSGNSAGYGGGIYIHGTDDYTTTITNSSISGNEASLGGGGVYNFQGNAVIQFSTITNNAAPAGLGGGVASWADPFTALTTVHSSIIAGNDGSDLYSNDDISNSFVSDGYNLIGIGDGSSAFTQTGDQTGVADPMLGLLADNGGPTKTHALLPGSLAIDAGDPDFISPPDYDQRGAPFGRVIDGNGDFIARIDIGALESETVAFVVDTLDDNDDANYGPGELSLREAIDKASLITTSIPLIVFDASIHGGTIELSLGELAIGSSMTIDGPGASLMTIDAVGLGRIFNIDDYDGGNLLDVIISGLTITGGEILDSGGAILNSENLTVADSVISGNSADSGGGIYSFAGSLQVVRSTISGNGAISSGGGILNAFGNASITDSTLSGNSAGYGGGLYIGGDVDYTTTVTNSTISGNISTLAGGGIYNFQGDLLIQYSTITDNDAPTGLGGGVTSWADPNTALTTVRSSIIAGNDGSDLYSDDDIFNSFVSDGYNLIGTGDGSSAFTQMGDQTGVTDPMLGLLADNGGPTWTHALLEGSPAIDAGDPLAEAGINGVPEFDQRRTTFDRVRDGGLPGNTAIDIGAFEVQDSLVADLPGDYNGDGKVSAADYTVWRDTNGSESDLRADGSGSTTGIPDGIIDDFDYDFWIANYGNSQEEGSGSSAQLQSGNSSQIALAEPVAPEAGRTLEDKETGRQGEVAELRNDEFRMTNFEMGSGSRRIIARNSLAAEAAGLRDELLLAWPNGSGKDDTREESDFRGLKNVSDEEADEGLGALELAFAAFD